MRIYREESRILPIFEEIMCLIYKNLLWKIWYFNNPLNKKKEGVLLISSETMHLCSQLGGKKSLHINNQPGKNPVILFLIFTFYAPFFKLFYLFYNCYYCYFTGTWNIKLANVFLFLFNVSVKIQKNYFFFFLDCKIQDNYSCK